jgi:glycosyltransferase involved in cell wall biosynthesis
MAAMTERNPRATRTTPTPALVASPSEHARLSGRELVCVGFADWDTELWTNQQHLMARLANENRVLFIESLGLRQPQLAARDLKRMLRRLRRGLALRSVPEGPVVLSPLVVPIHRFAILRALNRRLLDLQVRRAIRKLGFADPILWAYVPQAEALLRTLDPPLVVYHCVDDIAAQPGIDAASTRSAEQRFARRADLVLASSPKLAERMRTLSRHVLYAPNVADTAHFASALEDGPVDAALEDLPRPRILFMGAIVASKLDMTLLASLARLRPQWSFVLVGPVGPGDPRTDVGVLGAEPNVYLLGGRAYAELPAVLRGVDAGLIPYARNELTASIFPMKVYEYLAAGRPVVAAGLPALAEVADVATADDAEATARLLDDALAHDSAELRAERSRRAQAHSWERRLEEIAEAISSAFERRRAQVPKPGGGVPKPQSS